MREWKAQGRFRYLGVHALRSRRPLPRWRKSFARAKLDFVQINYSIMEREAEEKILPLAQDRGVAVIVNRPFSAGDLFHRVRGKAVARFRSGINCTSWAQFLLKWIVAHPAVTCAIPATNNVQHLEDNMRGGVGRIPDAKLRQRMIEALGKIVGRLSTGDRIFLVPATRALGSLLCHVERKSRHLILFLC